MTKEVDKTIKNDLKANVPKKFPSSETGGVIPMNIASRFRFENARLTEEFTDTWRKWRVRYIKDQQLHPSEPLDVPELKKETTNILRRIYQYPLNVVEQKFLVPVLGKHSAHITRRIFSGGLIGYFLVCITYYQLKYNTSNWEKRSFANVVYTKPTVLPGDHRYPFAHTHTKKQDFYDLGFSERKVFLN